MAEIRWAHDAGLRGGVLLPGTPPGLGLPQLFDPCYDPLWQVCEELGMPVNHHTGSASPAMGPTDVDAVIFLLEVSWFAHRALTHLIVGGALERFPGMQLVFTEQGTAWVPEELREARLLLRPHGQRRRFARTGLGSRGGRAVVVETQRILGAAMPCGRQLHPPERGHHARRGRRRPHHVGQRLSRTKNRATRTRAKRYAIRSRACRTTRSRSCSAATRPSLYGFDLDALAPFAAMYGPRVRDTDQPLQPGELPIEAYKCPAFAGQR